MTKATNFTFLIAHTTPVGTNVAQCKIDAPTESKALELFAQRYPERRATMVGQLGIGV